MEGLVSVRAVKPVKLQSLEKWHHLDGASIDRHARSHSLPLLQTDSLVKAKAMMLWQSRDPGVESGN
jgi:hypothetical protein